MANYSCDTGFVLVGNNTKTCTGDSSSNTGIFDGEATICERELSQLLTHTLMYYNNYSDYFILTCASTIPCTYIVTCVLPASPLNGVLLTNTNQTESSVITFQCDPGFSLVGTETATCNNSGLWDPDPALLECNSKFIIMSQSLSVCCILTHRCGNNWCMECCCSIWRCCCYIDGTDLTGRYISHSHYHKENKK